MEPNVHISSTYSSFNQTSNNMVIRSRYSSDSSPRRQSKKIKTTHQFPEGIILEILARLPVKSLLRFRRVSKSWLSLISTPYFIKIHLQNSSKESSFHNRRVMVTSCYPSYSLKQCSALLLIHEPNTYAFNIDYPNKSTNQSVWVVGSCNGLVCIAISKKEWYLWNPSTKISKKLPSLDFIVKPTFHTFHNIYGFGYCESNDDYKVVGILSALGNAGVYESVVKVYSLRTNSWKRIEGFNFGVPLDNSGKFVAGKIHFAMITGIVSLDLESEVYGKIEQPNYEEGTILEPSLGVLGGCISVLCNYYTCADVWVMKEYGVEESWTKVVSVPYFNDPETKKLFYSRPLCLLSTRELLLVIDSQFVVYDKKDNSLRLSNFGRFLEADIYVESLISPIPEN